MNLAVIIAAAIAAPPPPPVALVFESDTFATQVAARVTTPWRIIHCTTTSSCHGITKQAVKAVVGRADAIDLSALPALRLVQSATYFHTDGERVPRHATIANSEWWPQHGDAQIAEFVIAAIFEQLYELSKRAAEFAACAFAPDAAMECAPASTATNHTMFSDLTIGVLGYGNIGKQVADRAAALGATVVATRRHGPFSPPPPGLKWLSPDNDKLYRTADVVVSCVPYSVLGLVNATALALMRDTALFIPISAGPVDFEALEEALRSRGRAFRAVLDLWPAGCWHYPNVTCGPPTLGQPNWPYASSALASLPNVLPLPGMAMRDQQFWDAAADAVAANLDRLAAGKPLANVVRNASVPGAGK